MSTKEMPTEKDFVLNGVKLSGDNQKRYQNALQALREGRLDVTQMNKGKDDLWREYHELNKKGEIAKMKGQELSNTEKAQVTQRSEELTQEIAMFDELLNEAAKVENK